jgi:hypothetical protein
MIAAQAAATLHGRQYGDEVPPAIEKQLKEAGLVAIFGASDDLVEIRGADNNELGAFEGLTFYFTRAGLLVNECEEGDDCPYFAKLEKTATPIEAKWGDGEFSWRFETAIPHQKFVIYEDGEPFCEGIVFALSDVPEPSHG